jgi:hypothetical protein
MQWTDTVVGALRLEDSVFENLRDAADGFRRGLALIVVISLIVGLVLSMVSFIQGLTTSPTEEIAAVQAEMQQVFEQMRQFGAFGGDDVAWSEFMRNFEAGIEIGRRVGEVVERTTPAPGPVVDLFEALGKWLSYPFGWISAWMLYGVLTLVFAKLLGGTASIQEMLAATSVVAAPHLLNALGFIPFVNTLLALVAFVWGLAIYVKGTAIANRFGTGRALLAMLAPVLTLIAVLLLLVLGVILLILISNS